MQRRNLTGRRIIYTDAKEVTRANVVEVLEKAVSVHKQNRNEIEYLYKYYKGDQPILYREKDIRPEINNTIVENRANEIVSFKVGYLMGEPLQYVNRSGREEAIEGILKLNEIAYTEDKYFKDKELAEWFSICGTSYRMILPDDTNNSNDTPFHIHTLDPRDTFVVYHNGLGHKPVMGVTYITTEDNEEIFSIYTENNFFEVEGEKILEEKPQALDHVPIFEYPANNSRLGEFEVILSILDAINLAASNRLDAIEQFIQALLVFKGVDITSEQYSLMRTEGGIKTPIDGDIKYLVQELNQTQTQKLVDHMYQTVLTICGMPNRNGGSSTSDTGSAVVMRDGWLAADARAKDAELLFKRSEKQSLKLALKIMGEVGGVKLNLSDVEVRFTRRNYENIQEKAQVLLTMLSNDKIHPQLAFDHCGMFIDSEVAYKKSQEYYEEAIEKTMKELESFSKLETNKSKEEVEDVQES